MAKIIANKINMAEELVRLKNKRSKGLVQIGAALIIAYAVAQPIAPIILLGGVMYFFTVSSQMKLTSMYLRKEKEAELLFHGLSDKYSILCNVTIEVNGRKNRLSYITVGPSGIYVVMTLNYNGTISGEENDKIWKQESVSKKGEKTKANIDNPIDELNTYVKRLSQLLEENGVETSVGGIIYFVYPEVKLKIETDIPVFVYKQKSKEITNYIMDNKVEELSSEQSTKIVDLLINKSNLSEKI